MKIEIGTLPRARDFVGRLLDADMVAEVDGHLRYLTAAQRMVLTDEERVAVCRSYVEMADVREAIRAIFR